MFFKPAGKKILGTQLVPHQAMLKWNIRQTFTSFSLVLYYVGFHSGLTTSFPHSLGLGQQVQSPTLKSQAKVIPQLPKLLYFPWPVVVIFFIWFVCLVGSWEAVLNPHLFVRSQRLAGHIHRAEKKEYTRLALNQLSLHTQPRAPSQGKGCSLSGWVSPQQLKPSRPSPTGHARGQPDTHQMIPGCIKLTIKTIHFMTPSL